MSLLVRLGLALLVRRRLPACRFWPLGLLPLPLSLWLDSSADVLRRFDSWRPRMTLELSALRVSRTLPCMLPCCSLRRFSCALFACSYVHWSLLMFEIHVSHPARYRSCETTCVEPITAFVALPQGQLGPMCSSSAVVPLSPSVFTGVAFHAAHYRPGGVPRRP